MIDQPERPEDDQNDLDAYVAERLANDPDIEKRIETWYQARWDDDDES